MKSYARISRWIVIVLVAAAPALLLTALVSRKAPLSSFQPYYNDEISNWHQILTFKEAGFQGGYYTLNENVPRAAFSHYYTYGPWYPMLYGTIARVTGWDYATGIYVNAALVAIAIVLFCISLRLDIIQIVAVGLFTCTFWAFLYYLFSMYQESVNHAFAIGAAFCFYHLIQTRERTSRRFQTGALLYLLTASLFRTSWAVLILPFFALTSRPSWRGWLGTVLKSVALVAVILVVSDYVSAPGNNSIFKVLGNFSTSFSTGLGATSAYFLDNLRNYLDIGRKYPLQQIQTIQTLGLILIFVAAGVLFYRRGVIKGQKEGTDRFWEMAFQAFNLLGIVLASLTLYLVGTGDYRVISTHLMLTGLLLIAYKRYRILALVVVGNLLFTLPFLSTYRGEVIAKSFLSSEANIAAFGEASQSALSYMSDAPNPWCNTLLFNLLNYVPELNAVPGGIGLSFYYKVDDPVLKFKSHYVLLSPEDMAKLGRLPNAPNLRLLTNTALGGLYENLDSDCQH